MGNLNGSPEQLEVELEWSLRWR